jgi:hypothetical protein
VREQGGKGRTGRKGEEMIHTLYAHMNKKNQTPMRKINKGCE